MINLDSDSDDELIPSVRKFDDLFAQVRKEVRRAETSTIPAKAPKSSKKDSSASRKKKLNVDDDDVIEVIEAQSRSKKNGSKKNKKDVSLSEDTQNLITQLDKLTEVIPNRRAVVPTSTSNHSALYEEIQKRQIEATVTASTTKSRGRRKSSRRGGSRGRGRGRKQLAVQDVDVVLVDDDLNINDVLEDSFTSTSEINEVKTIYPVEEEMCRLLVRWKTDVQKLQFPKGTKFSKIRMDVANKLSVRADDLVFLDELAEEIPDSESVERIKFGVVLDAFVRSREVIGNSNKKNDLDPNSIKLQVQGSGGHRERMTVIMKRTTHVQQLIDDYIEKFKLHGKQFKLIFDGETLDLTETPETLDLDGGEMFDIVEIKSK